MCLAVDSSTTSERPTPARAANPSALSRLAVRLSHSLCLQRSPLLDSAWHRLLLHREPGAVVVVVLPSNRTTRQPYAHTTRGVATAHSKQASSTSGQRDTTPLAVRQEYRKEDCNALLTQACLAPRPTFFVQAVRHIRYPAGWLGRPRKNHTPAHDLLRSATRHSHSRFHARRHCDDFARFTTAISSSAGLCRHGALRHTLPRAAIGNLGRQQRKPQPLHFTH